MNLKLYGICFKLRGGPDLLDHIQTGTPVPVDLMERVMEEMGRIPEDEIAFARLLDDDWKKAFGERVPLLMGVAPDGGYDINCTVPEELLQAVSLLEGIGYEKIVEEYTQSHLKNVCGVDAAILSVDMEGEAGVQAAAMQTAGFDPGSLDEDPGSPTFEDVSEAMSDGYAADGHREIPVEEPDGIPMAETDAAETDLTDGYPVDGYPVEYPDDDYVDAYVEDGYPVDGDTEDAMPEGPVAEETATGDASQEADADTTYQEAVRNIYTELVNNIKDRGLDERLSLRIGCPA